MSESINQSQLRLSPKEQLSEASIKLIQEGQVEALYSEKQQRVGSLCFPLILSPASAAFKTCEEAYSWFAKHGDILRQALCDHGALFFRAFPIKGALEFEKTLDEARFAEMPYVGGAAPREIVTSRRILTANEAPPDQPIPFHHEMAQTPHPPAYVFFYCEIAPQEGGATPIVHSHQVYQRFQNLNPEFCSHIEKHGAKYIRIMPFEDDPQSPIGRSWRSTFQTSSTDLQTAKEQAEKCMREVGTTWRWLEHNQLYTQTAAVPAIRVEERTQYKTFFNSIVAAYTGWKDQRNDPTKAVICGDHSAVNGEVLLATEQAMKEEQVALKWQVGDMLWIDNQLTMHSRQPYQGERRILAAIAP